MLLYLGLVVFIIYQAYYYQSGNVREDDVTSSGSSAESGNASDGMSSCADSLETISPHMQTELPPADSESTIAHDQKSREREENAMSAKARLKKAREGLALGIPVMPQSASTGGGDTTDGAAEPRATVSVQQPCDSEAAWGSAAWLKNREVARRAQLSKREDRSKTREASRLENRTTMQNVVGSVLPTVSSSSSGTHASDISGSRTHAPAATVSGRKRAARESGVGAVDESYEKRQRVLQGGCRSGDALLRCGQEAVTEAGLRSSGKGEEGVLVPERKSAHPASSLPSDVAHHQGDSNVRDEVKKDISEAKPEVKIANGSAEVESVGPKEEHCESNGSKGEEKAPTPARQASETSMISGHQTVQGQAPLSVRAGPGNVEEEVVELASHVEAPASQAPAKESKAARKNRKRREQARKQAAGVSSGEGPVAGSCGDSQAQPDLGDGSQAQGSRDCAKDHKAKGVGASTSGQGEKSTTSKTKKGAKGKKEAVPVLGEATASRGGEQSTDSKKSKDAKPLGNSNDATNSQEESKKKRKQADADVRAPDTATSACKPPCVNRQALRQQARQEMKMREKGGKEVKGASTAATSSSSSDTSHASGQKRAQADKGKNKENEGAPAGKTTAGSRGVEKASTAEGKKPEVKPEVKPQQKRGQAEAKKKENEGAADGKPSAESSGVEKVSTSAGEKTAAKPPGEGAKEADQGSGEAAGTKNVDAWHEKIASCITRFMGERARRKCQEDTPAFYACMQWAIESTGVEQAEQDVFWIDWWDGYISNDSKVQALRSRMLNRAMVKFEQGAQLQLEENGTDGPASPKRLVSPQRSPVKAGNTCKESDGLEDPRGSEIEGCCPAWPQAEVCAVVDREVRDKQYRVRVECSAGCSQLYHYVCLSSVLAGRTAHRVVGECLGGPCPTLDCEGAVVYWAAQQTKGIVNRHGKQLTVDERDQVHQKREADRAQPKLKRMRPVVTETIQSDSKPEEEAADEEEAQCPQTPKPSKPKHSSTDIQGLEQIYGKKAYRERKRWEAHAAQQRQDGVEVTPIARARKSGPGLDDIPEYVIDRRREEKEERMAEEERRNEKRKGKRASAASATAQADNLRDVEEDIDTEESVYVLPYNYYIETPTRVLLVGAVHMRRGVGKVIMALTRASAGVKIRKLDWVHDDNCIALLAEFDTSDACAAAHTALAAKSFAGVELAVVYMREPFLSIVEPVAVDIDLTWTWRQICGLQQHPPS